MHAAYYDKLQDELMAFRYKGEKKLVATESKMSR